MSAHPGPIGAGRPEAAAAIWSWRPAPPPPRPAPGPIRVRGVLQASVGLAVAGGLAWLGYLLPAIVVGSVASTIALAALLSPLGLFAALEHAFVALGVWIGKAMTWLLLPAIFYGFFVPFGVLFRRGRRDSMRRFFDAEAASYWTPRDARAAHTASASHERQY
jgi:hypothetical protein